MVQLVDSDIKTREVLGWKGVHVLHFSGSSCSQKLRIFLNLKGIAWESHLVDLPTNENFTPWFLGINPRGLVPGSLYGRRRVPRPLRRHDVTVEMGTSAVTARVPELSGFDLPARSSMSGRCRSANGSRAT